MTAAAAVTETLKDVEVIRQQAHMNLFVVQKNTEGVTQEESLIQPAPGGNCMNFVVGHLLAIYNQALPTVGQEPVRVAGDLARYDRGAPPVTNAAEALAFRDLVEGFAEATRRFDAGLGGLTSEVLDQPVAESPSGNPDETVRSLLATISMHQSYHAGQTGILRRIAGKEGAIR
jgi:hypothetical protein